MTAYTEKLDADRQIGMEEWIARQIAEAQMYHASDESLPDTDLNNLGRVILCKVIEEFRPDLVATAEPEIPEIPSWGCAQYGDYGHDWLDCPDCLANYEEYLSHQGGLVRREDTGAPAPITPDELRNYLKNKGKYCPKCETTRIQTSRPGAAREGTSLMMDVHCLDCGYEWVDIHELTSAEASDEFFHDSHFWIIPSGLSAKGAQAAAVIRDFCTTRLADKAGQMVFRSPSTWQGEHGKNSLLIVCHDGGPHDAMTNMDGAYQHCSVANPGYADYEALVVQLKEIGVFIEQCTRSYSAVYNCGTF